MATNIDFSKDFLADSKEIYDDSLVSVKTVKVTDEAEHLVKILYKVDNVVILPYRTNEYGNITEIGILREFNPIREDNYSDTLVTGCKDEQDETALETAKRELKEETGYDVVDEDKWTYLGILTTSKMVDCEHPCYAVNLNDLAPKKLKRNEIESASEFKFISLRKAIYSEDCFILSLIMKLFVTKFNKVFTTIQGK